MNNPYKTDLENPEWTDEMFAQAVSIDKLPASLQTKLGRPAKINPKQAVTIRYDSDIIARFKKTGKGWQTRMNNALRDYLDTHAI